MNNRRHVVIRIGNIIFTWALIHPRDLLGYKYKLCVIRDMTNSPSPHHKSPASSLSPLSSRFAAEAETENIRILKQECRGLSIALKTLKRNSEEWVKINQKLEIAREELSCMVEDRNLLKLSFTGSSNNGSADLNVEQCLPLIPTPPLGRKEAAINDSGNAFSSLIASLPVLFMEMEGVSISSQDGSDHTTSDAATLDPPLVEAKSMTSAESKESGRALESTENTRISQGLQSRKDSVDPVPMYSLEWFKIRMEAGSASKEGAGRNSIPKNPSSTRPLTSVPPTTEIPLVHGRSQSPSDPCEIGLVPELSNVKISRQGKTNRACLPSTPGSYLPERKKSNGDENLDLKDLSDKLKTVRKYSLEWFALKKEITAATKILGKDENDLGPPMKTSQDHQLQQHQQQRLPSEKSQNKSSTKNVYPTNLPRHYKDSMIEKKKASEQKINNLNEKLKRVPKYSLDWFQINKEIEALKREGSRSSGLSEDSHPRQRGRSKTKSGNNIHGGGGVSDRA